MSSNTAEALSRNSFFQLRSRFGRFGRKAADVLSSLQLMVLKGYIERKHLQTELCVVHVNHGIRQEAGDDEEFARILCERMGVEFMAYHIDAAGLAKQLGMSVEEAGRKERYRIFNEACKGRNARIAVAHHMNDQAETVLMNLSRGTSLKGIGGIRPVRDNIKTSAFSDKS